MHLFLSFLSHLRLPIVNFNFNRSISSGMVTLYRDSKAFLVYCHMGNFGCGDGGWTTVMKIDGHKVGSS